MPISSQTVAMEAKVDRPGLLLPKDFLMHDTLDTKSLETYYEESKEEDGEEPEEEDDEDDES